MDDCPLLVAFVICAQNLPPPRPPLRPLLGGLTSGCLATTESPTRNGWAWLATALSGEYITLVSSAFGTM